MIRLPVGFLPRSSPLEPRVAVGRGPVVRRLVERLLRFEPSALADLLAVGRPDLLAIMFPKTPVWVDGVEYLGCAPDAPTLYVPTHRMLDVPAPLVARALGRRFSEPIALLTDWVAFSLESALVLTPSALQRFYEPLS